MSNNIKKHIMENKERLLMYIESFLGDGVNTSRENYAFHCPFCNHHKKKLEVNLENYKYNCWTCQDPPTRGKNFIYLLYTLGAEHEIINKVKSYMNKDLLKKWTSGNLEKTKKVKQINITLPDEYVPFIGTKLDWTGKRLYKFLIEDRGLSDNLIKSFKIGYCSSGKYRGRIILPLFDKEGKVVYFNARAVSESYESVVKYYDPLEKGSSLVKRNIVPMEFFVNTNYPITLVEGVFDFYQTPNSIPMMGTTIFPGLLSFLLQDKIVEINLALDTDALKKSIRYAELLRSFGKVVNIIRFDKDKDPGSTGYLNVIERIKRKEKINDITLLKLKLNGF